MSYPYDRDRHHRRSIRLQGYDYSQAGAYFVTICVQHRLPLLGAVVNETVALSEAGRMVQRIWDELAEHYPGVETDAFVVMPNHIHGILVLSTSGQGLSLPDAVHRLKSLTTTLYRQGVTSAGWPAFPGRLWQRNYYEHIIRDVADLDRIRDYIVTNPARWIADELYLAPTTLWGVT